MDNPETTKPRLSNIFHRKAKPAQGHIAEQGPSNVIKGKAVQRHIPETEDASQAPMMSTNIPSIPPSSDQYLLFCVIEGEPIVFGVPVSANSDVSGLKKLICDERSMDTLRDVGRHTLELWKPRVTNAILAKPADTLLERIESMGASLPEFAEILDPTDRLSEVFPTEPSRKHVQIIVKMTVGKRRRKGSSDFRDIIGRWQAKRLKFHIPSLVELKAFVDKPLLDNEKIPLDPERFQSLINMTTPSDWCSRDDVEALFRSEDGHSVLDKFFFIVSDAPPHSGTESLFHSFWDANVRKILELLLPGGWSTRDSSRHTATGFLRPDFAFILYKLCPFRGEEKPPGSNDDPRAELSTKLAWAYDPAPYVLGYYAIGARITLVAITPPGLNKQPVVHDIATADLSLRRHRIKNIRRLINIAGVLQHLAELVRPLDAEFEVLERQHGTVEIAGHYVVKTSTGPDKVERTARLKNTYRLLAQKNVPHVDSILYEYDTTLVLQPRGISKPPESEDELLAALVCVLEALDVLHQEPPVFHRDIRWPNVMRRLDNRHKWFIIDWEDASTAPTKAQSHFDHTTHSPRAFDDGHGAEVDIWGVGELVVRCGSLHISEKLRNLGKRMQGEAPPSVQEALKEVESLQLQASRSS